MKLLLLGTLLCGIAAATLHADAPPMRPAVLSMRDGFLEIQDAPAIDPAKIWPLLADAAPGATPSTPPVLLVPVPTAGLTAQQQAFQDNVMGWYQVAKNLWPVWAALTTAIVYLVTKVKGLDARADRQAANTGTMQNQLTNVAIAAGPGAVQALAATPPAIAPPTAAPGPGKIVAAVLVVGTIAACIFLGLQGCSTTTADPATNIRNAGINAEGSAALQDAVQLLTQAGVNELTAAVGKDTKGNANAENVALVQNAAASLWSVQQPVNLTNLVTSASAGRAAQTAIEAAKVAAKSTGTPAQTAAAIATVLSTATGATPSSMGAAL